jgi:hypothetical protein
MQILLNTIKNNDGGINFRGRIVAQRLGEMRLSPQGDAEARGKEGEEKDKDRTTQLFIIRD